MRKLTNAQREEAVRLFRDGWTLQRIGIQYGVTREAIRYWITAAGVTGGARLAASEREKNFRLERDAKYLAKYGFPFEKIRELWALGVVNKFLKHRDNAIRRGVSWELTLDQWWGAWLLSGRWGDRGRSGYCMARKKDRGPYKIGNIYFCTTRDNSKHARKWKRWGTYVLDNI